MTTANDLGKCSTKSGQLAGDAFVDFHVHPVAESSNSIFCNNSVSSLLDGTVRLTIKPFELRAFTFGGSTQTSALYLQYTDDVICFNAQTHQQEDNAEFNVSLRQLPSTTTPLPVPICGGTATSVGGTVYVTGGPDKRKRDSKLVQIYHADSDRWIIGPDMLWGSDYHASSTMGHSVVVVGGSLDDKPRRSQILDTRTSKWRRISNTLVDHPWHPALVTVDESIYVIGGRHTSSVEVYDAAANSWRQMAPMQRIRHQSTTCVYDGDILTIGSYDGRRAICERYSVAKNTWTSFASLDYAWSAGAAFVTPGYVHCLGGYLIVEYEEFLDRSIVLNVASDKWSIVDTNVFFERDSFAAVQI